MTMTNAEWCIKNGYKFRDIDASRKDDSNWEFEFKIRASDGSIKTIGYLKTYNSMYPSEAALEWLDMEHVESILDDAERRYLAGVIRPFRDNVKSIEKLKGYIIPKEYIEICLRSEEPEIELPFFNAGTMYKGMEVKRHYTLEELGL